MAQTEKRDDWKLLPVPKPTPEERKKRMGEIYNKAMEIDSAHSHDAPLHINNL